jgi:hypothetical protein
MDLLEAGLRGCGHITLFLKYRRKWTYTFNARKVNHTSLSTSSHVKFLSDLIHPSVSSRSHGDRGIPEHMRKQPAIRIAVPLIDSMAKYETELCWTVSWEAVV